MFDHHMPTIDIKREIGLPGSSYQVFRLASCMRVFLANELLFNFNRHPANGTLPKLQFDFVAILRSDDRWW